MLDLYALSAGFYPLVGNPASLNKTVNRDRYGIAASAATVANFYLNQEDTPRTTGIPGNVAIYGEIDDANLGRIRDSDLPQIQQTLMGRDPVNLLEEVRGTVDKKYLTKLKQVEQTGEGLTGRSMEEMQIPGFSVAGEAAGRALMDVSGPNPPDFLTDDNKGFEVTRQRLGKRGHAFIGSAATQIQQAMTKVKATTTKTGMARYKEMANEGLKVMQGRFRSFNQIIGATVKKIEQSGKKATKQTIADHFSKIKKMPTGKGATSAEKAANREARSIALGRGKGRATNYMTDEAMTHIMHHIAFRNPMIDTYVLDDGVFAYYGPITQFSARAQRKFQFRENLIKATVDDELVFASDTIINFDQAGMSAMDRGTSAFAGWATKNMAKHGQVIQTGEALKSRASVNKPKLVPSIAVSLAEQEFGEQIGKKLFRNAGKIAEEMLNEGTFLNELSKKLTNSYSTIPVNNSEMWAQPYISAMSFREQAYG